MFAKLNEPDHTNDFYSASGRFQGAAWSLVGQRFDTGAAVLGALRGEVNPVIREVYEESRQRWDNAGLHRPRDLTGSGNLIGPMINAPI